MGIQEEIQDLKTQITHQRERAAEYQLQLDSILADLRGIKSRYDAEILPQWERVEMVKREIAKLRYQTQSWGSDYIPVEEQYRQSWVTGEKSTKLKEDDPSSQWIPPDDYIPVEEQYRRKWTPDKPPSPADFIPPPPEPEAESILQDLKTLYRQLARRYHPDFADSDSDLALRTRLMAEINQAYEDEDIDALRALFTAGSGGVASPNPKKQESAEALQLRQLKIIHNDLRRKIFTLKQQIHDLEQSDLMRLKHQEWMMRLQGRKLFKEMAEELEIEYTALREELYRLRHSQS